MFGCAIKNSFLFCFYNKKNKRIKIHFEKNNVNFFNKSVLFFFCFLFISFTLSLNASSYLFERREHARSKRIGFDLMRQNKTYGCCRRNKDCFSLSHSLGYIVHDAGLLHYNLFSWDTVKIAVSVFPFYTGARMIDERLQDCFFDHEKKKNINKPPEWCKKAARYGIGIPIAFLGSRAFLSRDEEQQLTAQVMLTGMPFVLITKDLIKKLRFDICLRPHHEKFSPEVRCPGGFPSGHLAEITYLTTLYGLRYGPQYAVPLGTLAVFVGATFLACNRHYLSQMVAGAAFGAIYAVAANKVVDHRLCYHRDINFGLCASGQKGVQLTFDMSF